MARAEYRKLAVALTCLLCRAAPYAQNLPRLTDSRLVRCFNLAVINATRSRTSAACLKTGSAYVPLGLGRRPKILRLILSFTISSLALVTTGSSRVPHARWAQGVIVSSNSMDQNFSICEAGTTNTLTLRFGANSRQWIEPMQRNQPGAPVQTNLLRPGRSLRVMYKNHSGQHEAIRIILQAQE